MPEQRRAGAPSSEAPHSRSKLVAQQRRDRVPFVPDLQRLLVDFKTGLGKLRGLTQQLAGSGANRTAPAQQAARIERIELMKTLERELRILERTAPPEIRDRVVSEFRSKAESAIQMGIPQAYAELTSAAPYVPSKALRPGQEPAVKSLLSAVRAIRSGRLAFLPRETRMEARKLLQGIFGSPKGGNVPRAPQIARTVEQQRLLPLVVQGMMRSYERPDQFSSYIDAIGSARSHYFPAEHSAQSTAGAAPMADSVGSARSHYFPAEHSAQSTAGAAPMADSVGSPASKQGEMPASSSGEFFAPKANDGPLPKQSQSTPIGPLDLARLSKAGVPSFQTTGVAHAFTYEPNESVHTIDRNDGLMTAAEAPAADAKTSGPAGAVPRRDNTRVPQMAAPMASSANVASSAAADRTQQTLNVSDKPTTMQGTLDIRGLPEFIGDITARVTGLERKLGSNG